MFTEPIVTIRGYVLAKDYSIPNSARFIEKIERTKDGMSILSCPNVEDAMIFEDMFQAKAWCVLVNADLENRSDPDKYVPLQYKSGLQELEE